MSSDRNTLKLYMGDTGLLVSLAYDESEETRAEVQRLILYGKLEANLGMVMENLVGQMIVASGRKLYFYARSDNEDAEERMEVDFLIAKRGIGRRHNISAVEVKKTKRLAFSSLTKFKAKFSSELATSYVVHAGSYEKAEDPVRLPVYLLPFAM